MKTSMEVISNNEEFIIVNINDKCLTIFDSYKIKDNKLKEWFLFQIKLRYPIVFEKRSFKSIMNEWKVHNAFYKRNILISKVKNTDIELKQNIFVKILYSIASKIFKE